jgi:hypothetical protein
LKEFRKLKEELELKKNGPKKEEEVGTARGRDFGGHGGGVSCWVGGISGGREVLVALKGVQW